MNDKIADQATRPHSMEQTVGSSAAITEVYRIVDRIAPSGCTVLITGESGTGKELVAQAVHSSSPRASMPFVAVNCGAIPEALLESELFGHIRGAFTGAHATTSGRLAAAKGGTLLLDELGELPHALQVKLLRVLQTQEYSPVGDSRTHRADVRIVAATNIDLDAAVASGKFREDLYYRLNVIQIVLPPLRERRGDIAPLVKHFAAISAARLGRPPIAFSPAAISAMEEWSWPGNVRELENTVERAVILCGSDMVEPQDLPTRFSGLSSRERGGAAELPDSGIDLRATVEEFENNLIRQALERTGWNKNRAARLLGLNRTTLVEMLKRKRFSSRAGAA